MQEMLLNERSLSIRWLGATRVSFRAKQADFFFRFRSCENIGLRSEDLCTIAANFAAMNLSSHFIALGPVSDTSASHGGLQAGGRQN
jgi:hypothetical protein